MIGLFVKKGQSTAEYAILFAIVIAVISGMQLYVRRGLNLRLRDASDNIPVKMMGYVAGQAVTGPGGKALDTSVTTDLFIGGAQGDMAQYEAYYSDKGKYAWKTNSSDGTEAALDGREGGRRDVSGRWSARTGNQNTKSYEEAD